MGEPLNGRDNSEESGAEDVKADRTLRALGFCPCALSLETQVILKAARTGQEPSTILEVVGGM